MGTVWLRLESVVKKLGNEAWEQSEIEYAVLNLVMSIEMGWKKSMLSCNETQ